MPDNLFRQSEQFERPGARISQPPSTFYRHWLKLAIGFVLLAAVIGIAVKSPESSFAPAPRDRQSAFRARSIPVEPDNPSATPRRANLQPRKPIDSSGMGFIITRVKDWPTQATMAELSDLWKEPGHALIREIDKALANPRVPKNTFIEFSVWKAICWNYEGQAERAYEVLTQARSRLEVDQSLADEWLSTVIFLQAVCGMRRGENQNCILCRGESSCILPISRSAVHVNPEGSRLAIKHFLEYLELFPNDTAARWLLNLAHMTLGEHPAQVDPRFVITLDHWQDSEFDIGVFRDIGHLTKLDRFNQSGGAILEDFDNDGNLDVVVTTINPAKEMGFYHNTGKGTFEDRSQAVGVLDQLGGLNCVQADYNNDGWMDIYIPRGAWFLTPMRPTLLRNDGQGHFMDVTAEAGLLDPVNSNSATWADYDNDGWLDLFVCCERQPNRLFRNRADGTFESVAQRAGVQGEEGAFCKGAAWIDYDNDDYPDLFLNNLSQVGGQLYRNNHDGTFASAGVSLGIDGPKMGFSCWAWDYDNDSWLDIFATCYEGQLKEVVLELQGKPHRLASNKLFRNREGRGFEDVTKNAGLDLAFSTMGSNFGDFDNDGFLDMYLGTGDPHLSTLIPNRMFKNVAGKRFAEITASSRTGNLQKGHGVACGDWDRDGDVDIFIQMGGAVPGDSYHNVLFQNPGQGNHWLTVRLVGQKTNRAAIGARIKAITAGDQPLTIHRHVSSGSSFGASPLQQHLGLAQSERVALLEIHWPTSGTTQVFRDIAADQALEITEFAEDYKKLDWQPIPLPRE